MQIFSLLFLYTVLYIELCKSIFIPKIPGEQIIRIVLINISNSLIFLLFLFFRLLPLLV